MNIYKKYFKKNWHKSVAEYGSSVIYRELKSYQLIDVNSSSTASLKERGLRLVDIKTVYYDTQEWYKTKKL